MPSSQGRPYMSGTSYSITLPGETGVDSPSICPRSDKSSEGTRCPLGRAPEPERGCGSSQAKKSGAKIAPSNEGPAIRALHLRAGIELELTSPNVVSVIASCVPKRGLDLDFVTRLSHARRDHAAAWMSFSVVHVLGSESETHIKSQLESASKLVITKTRVGLGSNSVESTRYDRRVLVKRVVDCQAGRPGTAAA